MRPIKFYITLLVILVLANGCTSQPSEYMIQTAIAQTNAVVPTNTESPTVTVTPSFTPSPTVTLTSTLVNTATPTPDVRIITTDSKDFLLEPSDLPLDAKYYLPDSSWISPHLNEEVISTWGVEKGRDYVIKTGRIKGWWVYYLRSTRAVQAPEQVFSNVIMYKTAEGAQLTVNEYNYTKTEPQNGYKIINPEFKLGDVSIVLTKETTNSGGDTEIVYVVEFTYRNYAVRTIATGLKKDLPTNFVENAARAVLQKLEKANLEYPLTSTPTP